MSRTLRVYLDGTPVGVIEQNNSGANSFTYDDAYRARRSPTPLSLSMPVAAARHTGKRVTNYLEGLLPDSDATRERWAQQYAGANPKNAVSLLAHVGRDAAGAVQVLDPDESPTDATARSGDISWLSQDDFHAMLHDLARHGSDWNPGRYGGRWSLAGAQSKVALFRAEDGQWGVPNDSTPTTHIIKPALPDLAHHHINETLCMRAAAALGLQVASVDLLDDGHVRAIVVRRYDRVQSPEGSWRRLHQEDLCQALSVHPSVKYQFQGGPGVGAIADLLRRLRSDDRRVSVDRFFRGLAFNCLIAGTDAHAKNYSLLLAGPRAQLAPLYDLGSAACYDQFEMLKSAMKIGEHWKFSQIGQRDWVKTAQRLGIPREEGVAIVEKMRAAIPEAFTKAVASLPASAQNEAGRMAERIVEHAEGRWRPNLDVDPRTVTKTLDSRWRHPAADSRSRKAEVDADDNGDV